MPLESCTGGHTSSKSTRTRKLWTITARTWTSEEMLLVLNVPKNRGLWPKKMATNGRNHKFRVYRQSRVPGVTGHRNPFGTQKPWTIAHENGQKNPKSRVLAMPLESCTGGHRASKSSWEPKTVDHSPRIRPEMPEISSFKDVARVVYRR